MSEYVDIEYVIYWRRDSKSLWIDYTSTATEEEGREVVAFVQEAYPHYEVELRKCTTTEEVLDA